MEMHSYRANYAEQNPFAHANAKTKSKREEFRSKTESILKKKCILTAHFRAIIMIIIITNIH